MTEMTSEDRAPHTEGNTKKKSVSCRPGRPGNSFSSRNIFYQCNLGIILRTIVKTV